MVPHPLSISEKSEHNVNEEVMATVFWDRKEPLLIDFLPLGDTLNAAAYCETLKKLRRAIKKNPRYGMATKLLR
jgi:hypothetical protein